MASKQRSDKPIPPSEDQLEGKLSETDREIVNGEAERLRRELLEEHKHLGERVIGKRHIV